MSRVITRVTTLITLIRGFIAPLITTPEPPSRLGGAGGLDACFVAWLRVLGTRVGGRGLWGCGDQGP